MGEFVSAAQKQQQVGGASMGPLIQLMLAQQRMQAEKDRFGQRMGMEREKMELQEKKTTKSDKWKAEERKWRTEQNRLDRAFKVSEGKLNREGRANLQKAAKAVAKKADDARKKYREAKDAERKKQIKEGKLIKGKSDSYKAATKLQWERHNMLIKLQKKQDTITDDKDGKKWRAKQAEIDEASKNVMAQTDVVNRLQKDLKKLNIPIEGGVPAQELFGALKSGLGEEPMKFQRQQQQKQFKKILDISTTGSPYEKIFHPAWSLLNRFISGGDPAFGLRTPLEVKHAKKVSAKIGGMQDLPIQKRYTDFLKWQQRLTGQEDSTLLFLKERESVKPYSPFLEKQFRQLPSLPETAKGVY